MSTPTHLPLYPLRLHSTLFQLERTKRFNKGLYAANKSDLLAFILQAGAYYQLEQAMIFEVLSLIEHFFIEGALTQFKFTLKEMKMVCLGCLSIRLKLHEYRALAASLISSISSSQRTVVAPKEIALFELIVLKEFNYDIIGLTNIGLGLFYSLMRVNCYFNAVMNSCFLSDVIAVLAKQVAQSIRNSVKRICLMFEGRYRKRLGSCLLSIIKVAN